MHIILTFYIDFKCFAYGTYFKLDVGSNVGFKTLLHQGLSEPEFYGDLVYKFKNKI